MKIPHMRFSVFVALLATGCHAIRPTSFADGFEPAQNGIKESLFALIP
jgi:hypothetical protein